jgi:hypothetical protein
LPCLTGTRPRVKIEDGAARARPRTVALLRLGVDATSGADVAALTG